MYRIVVSLMMLGLLASSGLSILTTPGTTPRALATDTPTSSLRLEHKPVFSATAGKKVPVNLSVSDEHGIAEVRLYFKTMAAPVYLFVLMSKTGKDSYRALLPPPKNNSRGIDYQFVIKNRQGGLVKSRVYRTLVLNDYQIDTRSTEIMQVYVEAGSRVPRQIMDFAIALDVKQRDEALQHEAIPYPYPPITVPGPQKNKGPGQLLSGPGSVTISIMAGEVGISYQESSGQ